MRRAVAVTIGVALVGASSCSRDQQAAPAPSGTPAPSTPAASATGGAQGNDGTDPKAPVLAPGDAAFVDARKGFGWGDRCFTEIKQGKLGWARAACDRALALPEVDPRAKPALLFNEGLIAEKSGDKASARSYFSQSLRLRDPSDPGRVEVARELVSVGGTVPTAQVETYTGKQLTEQMSFASVKPAYSDLSFATLYHADINNDGQLEWVLTERNSVGLHNDQLIGVYVSAPSSGVMIDSTIRVPSEGPFAEKSITYFASPFLRNDPEGVTMTLLEGASNTSTRYIWQKGHVRRLDEN